MAAEEGKEGGGGRKEGRGRGKDKKKQRRIMGEREGNKRGRTGGRWKESSRE